MYVCDAFCNVHILLPLPLLLPLVKRVTLPSDKPISMVRTIARDSDRKLNARISQNYTF